MAAGDGTLVVVVALWSRAQVQLLALEAERAVQAYQARQPSGAGAAQGAAQEEEDEEEEEPQAASGLEPGWLGQREPELEVKSVDGFQVSKRSPRGGAGTGLRTRCASRAAHAER